jgi:nicotinamide-nucleotide amidase
MPKASVPSIITRTITLQASTGFAFARRARKVTGMNAAIELKELMLVAPRQTLAVAESMTGGRVQALITGISGASEFFLGGVTAYVLEEKVKLLGVDRAQAVAVNCVSARVAEEMAWGACRLFGADLAVATTGYAEPAPAMGVTTPFAWVTVVRRPGGRPGAVRSRRVECPAAVRTEAQVQVADAALEALVSLLREEASHQG